MADGVSVTSNEPTDKRILILYMLLVKDQTKVKEKLNSLGHLERNMTEVEKEMKSIRTLMNDYVKRLDERVKKLDGKVDGTKHLIQCGIDVEQSIRTRKEKRLPKRRRRLPEIALYKKQLDYYRGAINESFEQTEAKLRQKKTLADAFKISGDVAENIRFEMVQYVEPIS